MLSICRTFFFVIIIFSTIFIGKNYNTINISTDLKDLSPTLSEQENIQKAIDVLSRDIESRFILIITGAKADEVKQASILLKDKLTNNEDIATGTDSSAAMLDKLKHYRFQVLSPKQREELQQQSEQELIEQAQRNLFRIDSSLQLLPFNEDPLNTFDRYISHLLENGLDSNSATQSLEVDNTRTYYQAMAFKIKQGAMQIDKQRALMASIEQINTDLSQQFSITILRSGVFFFAADAAEKSERDIKSISTISTVGIVMLLLLVFRSLTILLLPVISILIGIIFAVGVNHYLYGSIHILTIVFGASLIGIIIDYSLHFFYHQTHHSVHSSDRASANKLFRAMLLSLITSLVGYSALSLSSLDALKKVALFSCCGILAAWLSVMTIGSLNKAKTIHTHDALLSLILNKINAALSFISAKSSFPMWGLLALALSALIYTTGLPTNDDPRLFFKPAEDLIAQERQAKRFNNNFEPGRYVVISGNSSQEVYERFEQLSNIVQPILTTTGQAQELPFFSAMQLVPSPQQQAMDYRLQEKIYRETGIAEKLFLTLGLPIEQARALYSLYSDQKDKTLKPSILFNQESGLPPVWISTDKQFIAFVLIKKEADLPLLEKTISQHLSPADGITFINTLALSQDSLQQQRLSASVLLLIAYLFIALIMLIYYRSLQALWVLLVPLSATLLTLIIFTLLNINITLFHVMGLFLVLGLGMDYVIFIREMRDHNDVTQNAIMLSTMTTLLSFGLLSLSSIPVAQAFGITLLIGNSLNFIASLFYSQLTQKLTST